MFKCSNVTSLGKCSNARLIFYTTTQVVDQKRGSNIKVFAGTHTHTYSKWPMYAVRIVELGHPGNKITKEKNV